MEVLITYRVLFGQHRHAWRLYNAETAALVKSTRDRSDPLLAELCGRDWSEQRLFDELEGPTVKNVYSAASDFPFFGERLLELHQYIALLDPHDWKTLWHDRRDIARFWTVWAVIFFGVIATLLALVGLFLAAAQVAGSFR